MMNKHNLTTISYNTGTLEQRVYFFKGRGGGDSICKIGRELVSIWGWRASKFSSQLKYASCLDINTQKPYKAHNYAFVFSSRGHATSSKFRSSLPPQSASRRPYFWSVLSTTPCANFTSWDSPWRWVLYRTISLHLHDGV